MTLAFQEGMKAHLGKSVIAGLALGLVIIASKAATPGMSYKHTASSDGNSRRWEAAPKEVNPDLRAAGAQIIYIEPDGSFTLWSGTLYSPGTQGSDDKCR